ncbi:MAG: hypothetical protein HQM15_03685 [Deltaproteobacteria bacterium]|nr:hypothetical protein [Deltaproteobacteria bacterium]
MNISGDMKLSFSDSLSFQKAIEAQKGVFSWADLANFFHKSDSYNLNRAIKSLLEEKALYRFCKGFYVTRDANLEWLSMRICPESAISFTTVLAKELVVGTIPARRVYAAKLGTTRFYESEVGSVVHFGFNPKKMRHLWFGYDYYENGVRYADKEKAFLDTLYFYQSGNRFTYNIYSDIHVSDLDQKKLTQYLKKYRNPKFVKFVQGVIDGYDQ